MLEYVLQKKNRAMLYRNANGFRVLARIKNRGVRKNGFV